jgi:formate hydrogenlyase subunit 3/multisubunit Na+/H+ antiporter MnhD subunit
MYVLGGWWEMLASSVIAAILSMGFAGPFLSLRSTKYFYIFLSILSVASYAAVSMPFCNDFLTIFLTTELFSICGLGLFVISASRISGVAVFRYAVYNTIGGLLLLFGCVFIYGITGISDIVNLSTAAPATGPGFGYGFVLFVAG